jgi:hypothetical protein
MTEDKAMAHQNLNKDAKAYVDIYSTCLHATGGLVVLLRIHRERVVCIPTAHTRNRTGTIPSICNVSYLFYLKGRSTRASPVTATVPSANLTVVEQMSNCPFLL